VLGVKSVLFNFYMCHSYFLNFVRRTKYHFFLILRTTFFSRLRPSTVHHCRWLARFANQNLPSIQRCSRTYTVTAYEDINFRPIVSSLLLYTKLQQAPTVESHRLTLWKASCSQD